MFNFGGKILRLMKKKRKKPSKIKFIKVGTQYDEQGRIFATD